MAFIVEDGTGLGNANAFISAAYYREYHTSRGRTIGVGVTDANIRGWIIRATDYIVKRFGVRFKGSRLTLVQALPFPRTGITIDGSTPAMSVLLSAEIASGGTGYVAGDIVTIDGGEGDPVARVVVDTVDGSGVVTALSVYDAGIYTELPTSPNTPTGGTGSGLSLALTLGGPILLAQATAEYALRASEFSELSPDAPLPFDREDADGNPISGSGPVTSKSEKVGPIEESTSYAGPKDVPSSPRGSSTTSGWVIPSYPAADMLLEPLLNNTSSGVIRN